MQILVVDDDPLIAEFLRRCLSREGHHVEVCHHAMEARMRVRGESFDILITDILMPEMDGLELIQGLNKSQNRPTAVIAISGGGRNTSQEFLLDCAHKLGAQAILPKPFDVDQLLATIAEVSNPVGAPAHKSKP